LCEEQPPQLCPLTELLNSPFALQPNVENSFSTFFPWQRGQSGFFADDDINCSNLCEQVVHSNSYIGMPLSYKELHDLSIVF
jgi:hypothetical protein